MRRNTATVIEVHWLCGVISSSRHCFTKLQTLTFAVDLVILIVHVKLL